MPGSICILNKATIREEARRMGTRTEDALALADETLAKLELGEGSLVPIVLACLRLARLTGSIDAEKWFQCELRGYGPRGTAIDNWEQFAIWSGRHGTTAASGQQQYWVAPIEEIERELQIARVEFESAKLSAPAPEPENSMMYGQTANERILGKLEAIRRLQIVEIRKWSHIVATVRGSIHDWLSRVDTTLRYGEIVDNAFWAAKARFDALLHSRAPATEKALSAAFARADSSDDEEWSQALTSCRRALRALADAVYPPRDTPIDGHALGPDEYKNRLIQFAKDRLRSQSLGDVVEAEIELVAKRADTLNDLASKGVHSSVNAKDLELAVVHTYLLAGELLELLPELPEKLVQPRPTDASVSVQEAPDSAPLNGAVTTPAP